MARTTTGTKYRSRGVWYACITVSARKRETFAMPTCTTEEQAEARKILINDVVQRLRKAGHAALVQRFAKEAAERAAGKPLDRLLSGVGGLCCGTLVPRDLLLDTALFREVGEMWTSGELEQRYRGQVKTRTGAGAIAALLDKHVYPHVGEIPVSLIGPQHGQLILNSAPAGHDPDSLRNIAKLFNRILSLAVSPLKLIAVNPLPRGWIPKPGPKKARSCIYPTEDVQLLGCAEVSIGLRVLWGYLHREGHRKNEVFGLTWSDFDLTLGTINLDKNKTNQPRFWVLSPGVAALLRAWKRYREEVLGERVTGSDRVFFARGGRPPGTRMFHAARTYRENLQTAGIDRPQLFAHGDNRRQVRAHDTRAAFVTVALAAEKNELWIADRTGHSSMAEMATYRRSARAFIELKLGTWKPLDGLIPELLPYLDEASPSAPKAASAEPAMLSDAPPVPAAAAEAAGGVVEAAEGLAAAPEAATRPSLAAEVEPAAEATAAGCEGVEAPDCGELAAAPDCASDEGGSAPPRDGAGAIVGANVGARRGPRLDTGFVGSENRLDSPRQSAMQFPPTFGVGNSSTGTAP
jgi:integrase